MPFCPHCRAAYREGFTHCAECGLPLVEELPPREREPQWEPVDEVALATFPSQFEAEMWAELLANEGIPCVTVALGPGPGGWGSSAGLPHELRVRADQADDARALLFGSTNSIGD